MCDKNVSCDIRIVSIPVHLSYLLWPLNLTHTHTHTPQIYDKERERNSGEREERVRQEKKGGNKRQMRRERKIGGRDWGHVASVSLQRWIRKRSWAGG